MRPMQMKRRFGPMERFLGSKERTIWLIERPESFPRSRLFASWTAEQARCLWPQLSGSPQHYIACFATLAQLALAMTARRTLGAQSWHFALPAASDNTAAEARTETFWSTAEPLGSFVKLAAGWAARRYIELLVTHLAEAKFMDRRIFPGPYGVHRIAPSRLRMARPASRSAVAGLRKAEFEHITCPSKSFARSKN